MNEAKFGVRLDVKVVGFLSVGSATYEVNSGFGKFNPESNYVSFSLFSMYEMAFFHTEIDRSRLTAVPDGLYSSRRN